MDLKDLWGGDTPESALEGPVVPRSSVPRSSVLSVDKISAPFGLTTSWCLRFMVSLSVCLSCLSLESPQSSGSCKSLPWLDNLDSGYSETCFFSLSSGEPLDSCLQNLKSSEAANEPDPLLLGVRDSSELISSPLLCDREP